jgi:16S rRNA A1518/A1519 N6-dimethyltransferase RsmA/KsgA/DIM1 with predicted DNA glycosylase/AP lyase activity
MILPFIPTHLKTVWECTAVEGSRIVEVLRSNGYNVIPTHINDGLDFFEYEPDSYDIIITNPPYSIKDKLLKRAFDLKKPFMFLLPITTLEGLKRGKMFRKKGSNY